MSTITSPERVASRAAAQKSCRFCGTPLKRTFVDLGMSPLCETYILPENLSRGEMYYPLHAYVCETCFLVQLEAFETPENIFGEYAYFSSFSDSWLKHCEKYCSQMKARFGLNENSLVIEVASNDGYLLQYFVRQGVPVLGIDPAANVAKAAVERGVPTVVRFLGVAVAEELAREDKRADLIVANNVLAQVPDLNDFVEGLAILLKPDGVLTLEFPHLLRLIEHCEFDTIYHEHFSYFSMLTTVRILEAHGLSAFDVEELPSHGGSLRVYVCRAEDSMHKTRPSVASLIAVEEDQGLASVEAYRHFAEKVRKTKFDLVEFLTTAAREGKSVAGYGAPGKSTTLLHYCGVGRDLIAYTVDRNPYKQGRFLPGTRIPIYHTDRIAETKPDYVLVLPWNLKAEILKQLSFIREWGGRFVIPIPALEII